MKKPVVIGLAVVILAAVVTGGYWWYQNCQDNGLAPYGDVDIRTVNLSFRVGGCIKSLAMDEGDTIKAGQVPGELGHKPYKITPMQVKTGASVAQTQCDLMPAECRDEETAQAAVAVKRAQAAYNYAQNFYNRQRRLWKSYTVSANDLENARSSHDQAQATLKSTQDKLRRYRSDNREQDITQVKASLEQVQAQLAQAEPNLQDSALVAPSDDAPLIRAVEPGTMLNEDDMVLIVSLTRLVRVRAYVNERNLGQTQPGRKVLLYADSRPDKPYHGQIDFVSPTAESALKIVKTPDLRADLIYRLRVMAIDTDDASCRGMLVTVQSGDEAGHE